MQQLGECGFHRRGAAQIDLAETREIAVLLPFQDADGDPGLVLKVVVEGADADAGELTYLLDCRDGVTTFGERTRRRIDQPRTGLLGLTTAIAHTITVLLNPNSVSRLRRRYIPSSLAAGDLSAARPPQRLRRWDEDELPSLRAFT